MKPENVNPQNYKVHKILYTSPDGFFSIATGIWQDDGNIHLAMRWNGKTDDVNDKGYPSVFDNPMWFQLPIDLGDTVSVLSEAIKRKDVSDKIRTGIGNPPDSFNR